MEKIREENERIREKNRIYRNTHNTLIKNMYKIYMVLQEDPKLKTITDEINTTMKQFVDNLSMDTQHIDTTCNSNFEDPNIK